MNKQIYQAIYHASNQEEACRLTSLGLSDMKVIDIFKDYDFSREFPKLCVTAYNPLTGE